MKEILIPRYQCEICGEKYSSMEEARKCESKKILFNKKPKVGDVVRILKGDGTGEEAKVTSTFIFPLNWGPSKYWHTVGLNVRIMGTWSRQLTFEDYELVKEVDA